jgi:hypothetical protein
MIPFSRTDRIPHFKIQEFPNGAGMETFMTKHQLPWDLFGQHLHFSSAQPPSLANS